MKVHFYSHYHPDLIKWPPKLKVKLQTNLLSKKSSRQQPLVFPFFFPSIPHCSPSPLPIALFHCIPRCQSARRRAPWNNAPIIAQGAWLAPPLLLWVQWDWLLLRAPGFPDNSQILGPLCCCQEQRALMIAHCHWSRARDTQAQIDLHKPECLWGQKRGGIIISVFLEVCWGLSIYPSSTVIILFKFNWRISLYDGFVL